MSIPHLEWAKRLRDAGIVLRRDGLSQRATKIMVDLVTKTGSYKEAMVAAGRLKAICAAARYDDYWTEQVEKGFHSEMAELEKLAAQLSKNPSSSPQSNNASGASSAPTPPAGESK